MRHLFPLLATLCIGCPTPAPVVEPDEEPTETSTDWGDPEPQRDDSIVVIGQPVAVPPQFEPGCLPIADTQELVGVVEMLDFGKGARGVVIDDGELKWVVSYDAESVFADFEKDRVLARGRRCEKQGAAIKAYHFDVQSLRLVQ